MSLDRLPIWEHPAQRVTFVERRDQPGLLGVAKRGYAKVCALPVGYNGLSQVHMMDNGQVIVWHPDYPTLVCDFATGLVKNADIPPQLYFKGRRS